MVMRSRVGKDGKMETYEDFSTPSRASIDALRKEVKDIIRGNIPFHKDEFTPLPTLPEVPEQKDDDEQDHYFGYF